MIFGLLGVDHVDQENPNVVALYNEFHEKGLNIIGVSLDKEGDSQKWKEAIAKDGLTWNHVSNLKILERTNC